MGQLNNELNGFLLKALAAGLINGAMATDSNDQNSTATATTAGGNSTSMAKPNFAAGDLMNWISSNNAMLLRMSYVLLAITLLIVFYFAIKTCRLRRKSNVRRYDVLNAKKLETEFALDVDDSESEDEVYDSQKSLVKPQPPSPKR